MIIFNNPIPKPIIKIKKLQDTINKKRNKEEIVTSTRCSLSNYNHNIVYYLSFQYKIQTENGFFSYVCIKRSL